MAKIPKNPPEIFDEFVADMKSIFADDLESILLYGSAAKGLYQYKKSDINFMVIVSEQGIDKLARAIPFVKKWAKRKVSTPLVLTRSYIESSLDSFPMEFAGIQAHHELVFGDDVLKNLAISTDDLRLQCEREMKGKLLHLRGSFLSSSGKSYLLKDLVKKSIADFSVLFSALLKLKGVSSEADRASIVLQTVDTFGLNKDIFQQLMAIAEGKKKPGKQEWASIMENYIHEIRTLARLVDQLAS
ncbi:hypothetical protein JW960_00575 [candidate division KSB1 bacterium]|nr:hypothetical protein [candidate division KSB1 bacterium]